MIIGSSTMSISSGRNYISESRDVSTSKIGNEISVSQNVSKKQNSETYFKDVMKSEMIEESSDDMEKSMLGMKPSRHNVVSFTNAVSRENERRIREQTLMFLLKFLYKNVFKKNPKLNDSSNNFISNRNNQNQYNNSGQYAEPIASHSEYHSYYEEERTSFSTTGNVVTSDGRNISFNVDLSMSRAFMEEYYVEENVFANIEPTANLVDPLVINLDSSVASVSDQKFLFDIDSDGVLDSISQLNASSGFLALDINGDGVINDGSELFGTKSGNGFLDLSKYDEDGNGWIDEADSVFSKLMIWTKDSDGNDILYRLKDKGVGAISLENVSTNFSLKSLKDNMTNAVIRRTGVFLYENGQVGTMQQLDFAT